MIEFNLLPDVKLQYVKTRRIKRLVTLAALLVAGVSLVIFLLLLAYVDVVQHKSSNDLTSNINSTSSTLQGTQDLNKILTIQNQLAVLPTLQDQKPVASRLFGYMTEITPAQATISNMSADFVQHTLTITGHADGLATVNQYTDTLKFTTYTTSTSSKNTNAFSGVVLASFSSDASGADYTINASFDPTIFSETTSITLTVPKITTTRSVLDQPSDLFKQTNPSP